MIYRTLRHIPATVSTTFYAEDYETPADADGEVSVVVTDGLGNEVVTGTATLTSEGSGTYSFEVPGQAEVAELTVTLSGSIGGSSQASSLLLSVVGARYFTIPSLRTQDGLGSSMQYPASKLESARVWAEDLCDRYLGSPLGERWRVETLDAFGAFETYLGIPFCTRVLSITDAGVPLVEGTDFVFYPASGQILKLNHTPFSENHRAVVVTYAVALPFRMPPADLSEALIAAAADHLKTAHSPFADGRQQTVTDPSGLTTTYSQPQPNEAFGRPTGLPYIDTTLTSYKNRFRIPSVA